MNIILRPLILIALIIICFTACGKAPEPIPIELDYAEIHSDEFNAFLNSSPDYKGPIYNRIRLSSSNNILAYSLNEKAMTKEQFESAISHVAEIDSRQTIFIEFGDGASESDLSEFPSLRSFLLIGRQGKDPDSLRILKDLSDHPMCQ